MRCQRPRDAGAREALFWVVESVGIEKMVVRCCAVRMMSWDRSRWWVVDSRGREGGKEGERGDTEMAYYEKASNFSERKSLPCLNATDPAPG